MARKEFVQLMKENVMIIDRLAERLKCDFSKIDGYTTKQIMLLLRLQISGRSLLKDIAAREIVSTPNLCAMFRTLERDKLVLRTVDEKDRRNTWYENTARGSEIAKQALEILGGAIEELTSTLSREDEEEMARCMKKMNEILSKLEVSNA